MDIDSYLVEQIRNGQVVLFLGAGASADAVDPKGNHAPTGNVLRDLLADKFLGGKYKDAPLDQVGDYAISVSDQTTVQEYIRTLLQDLLPTPAQLLLPSLIWAGLATSNYDRLIERSYEAAVKKLQKVVPFIENGDRVEELTRDRDSVRLLKLHGCITRTGPNSCPLVLSTDQFLEHPDGRDRIYADLLSWARERTIVFVGYRLTDSTTRNILRKWERDLDDRPRYYMVLPDVDSISRDFWAKKKVTLISGTFLDFMQSLKAAIPSHVAPLTLAMPAVTHPLMNRFKDVTYSMSAGCQTFLDNDVEFVNAILKEPTVLAKDFYRGYNPGWSSIEQDLDVRRSITDTILADHVLIEESEHEKRLEFIVIKAHAGAGKSVALRRMAWDVGREYDKLSLYVRPYGVLPSQPLQEIISRTGERIFLFVDDLADRVRDILALIRSMGPDGKLLTIIGAERVNEWNVGAEALHPHVLDAYELKYLNSKEIGSLLTLLKTNDALGMLSALSEEDRAKALDEVAGRQLLVALHEATLGEKFEDIIENEFSAIVPIEAQQIYLSICVLNRLNVPVRAGLIMRMHGVPFDAFKKRLFAPLEHIVEVAYNPIIRDYEYRARHPAIAEIVFTRMLHSQEDRYAAYLRTVQALNIDYGSDRRAFNQMMRGRNINDLFPNYDLGKSLYEAASRQVGDDAVLFHQRAIYEMIRANGSLEIAGNLLTRASQLDSNDYTIQHSLAEFRIKCADSSRTFLERDRNLRHAEEIATRLKKSRPLDVHGYMAVLKVGLARLDDLLASSNGNPSSDPVEQLIKKLETDLYEAKQRFPGDSYVLDIESKLAKVLLDSTRARESLERAFDANPRASFFALRLATTYANNSQLDAAKAILAKALDANNNDQRLHFALAKALIDSGDKDNYAIDYHLKRSYTPGDSNYEAQLLYGRQLFITGGREASNFVFESLRDARLDLDLRERLRYPLDSRFRGSVVRIEFSYCWISRDGISDWIFAVRQEIDSEFWKVLKVGDRVEFHIAFNLRGPAAFEVVPES